MKTILFIALDYYPSAAVSAKRIAKFCKYIRNSGYEPLVLTVHSHLYDHVDSSLTSNGFTVYRTNTLRSIRFSHSKHVAKKLLAVLFKGFEKFAFPDPYILWLPYALSQYKKIQQNQSIDIIYATGPWFTAFLVGYFIKRLYGVPLVIEYRDQWSLNYAYRSKKLLFLHRCVDARLLKAANCIVFTSPDMQREYTEKFSVNLSKTVVIPNSYDPDDFSGITVEHKNKKFVFAYAGSFYAPRSADYLLNALVELQREAKIHAANFKLLVMGFYDERLLSMDGLDKLIDLKGILPHADTLKHLVQSDALLLIVANEHRANIPAKLFEYLAIGRPVLLLCPPGAAAEKIVAEIGSGAIANINDINDIKHKIQLFINHRADAITPRQFDKINSYSSVSTTKKLADMLATVDLV
ncbi:hypothetical protein EH223_16320 [candidate division KSB1 bacterium]|nr:glycosyltransferase family 4 protein [candidate division KSB1 bacterium]RQW01091.1 MAG: hypothetical protein EH223_16320 [candidate division KSB1 bacterium]